MYTQGKQIGKVDICVTVPLIFSAEVMSCGWGYGAKVEHASYPPPFQFNGTIKRVTYYISGEAIQDAESDMPRAMVQQ